MTDFELPWGWFVLMGAETAAGPFDTEDDAWRHIAYNDEYKSPAPDPPKGVRVIRRLDAKPSECVALGVCPSCSGGGVVERCVPEPGMYYCNSCGGTGRLP